MAENPNEIVGHGTREDGTHVPITRAEADALRVLQNARTRLKELGWKEGEYCPKDGTEFAAIEYGSTGIFTGWFDGKWPYDFAQIEDGGMHPYGYLWKPIEALTEAEAEAREASRQSTISHIEGIGRLAQALSESN